MARRATGRRRTEQVLNLSGCSEYRQLDDGTWEAYFATLDVRAKAPTRDEVHAALVEALGQRLDTGGDDVQGAFQQWAAANVIEIEVRDDELRRQAAERRHQKRYPPSTLAQLTADTFDAAVASPTPTAIDCWARWCEPCHAMAPAVHRLAHDMAGFVRVFGVDVEAHPALWERLDLKGIPTLIAFRNGRELVRIQGLRSASELIDEVRKVL